MNRHHWQFWIDVGGTFTDCFAEAPNGQNRILKVLSSAIEKTTVRPDSSSRFRVVSFENMPWNIPDFWTGCRLQLVDVDGEIEFESSITDYDAVTGKIGVANSHSLPVGSVETTAQILSDVPAPVLCIHQLLGIPLNGSLPPCKLHLGTTKGTNALLTRTGARTALVTSSGLRDVLTIGDQSRPHLFELTIKKT